MENAKQNPSVNKNPGSNVYESFGTYSTGVAAAATTVLLALASVFSKISNEFGNLFIDQADFQNTAANASANATVANAKDTATSTIFNGVAMLIGAVGQFVGASIGLNAYYSSVPENPELNLAKEYRDACDEEPNAGLEETNHEEIEMEDFSAKAAPEEEAAQQKQLQKRVEELSEIEDVERDLLSGNKGPLSEEEKAAVQTLGDPDQKALRAKLDDYISEQTKAQNKALEAGMQKSQLFNSLAQASGTGLGALAGKPFEALFQYDAGKEQAKVTLANEALQLAQNSTEQERNKADTFQQTASSEFDKLTQIRQAETSSQG